MIYTIGHSNHPIERFLSLLHGAGVDVVADVRSTPYSRFNPQFNRETLRKSLAEAGIRYVFLGEELGARSKDPSCWVDGRVSYARLAATPAFQRGLERLQAGMRDHRIALMCAEREPLECHRTLLVARQLHRAGVPVTHIRHDGTLEEHPQAMRRLLALLDLPSQDLFRTEDELFEEACDRQAARIAPVRRAPAGD